MGAKTKAQPRLCRAHHRENPCLLCVYEEETRENKERVDRLWLRLKWAGAILVFGCVLLILLGCY